MGKAEQKVQEAVQKAESSAATAVPHLQAQLSSLSKQRDAALADNHRLQGEPYPADFLKFICSNISSIQRPVPAGMYVLQDISINI